MTRTHTAFNRLNLSDPTPDDILGHASGLLRSPVFLEDRAHRLIAFADSGDNAAELVARWRELSVRWGSEADSSYDRSTGTLLVSVRTRDDQWGRVVVPLGHDPSPSERLVAHRTADALALHRLLEADHHALEWRARETLLDVLYEQQYDGEDDVLARCRAHGIQLEGQLLVGGCVRLRKMSDAKTRTSATEVRDSLAWVNRIMRNHHLPGLAGLIAPGQIRLLLFGPHEKALEKTMTRFAEHCRDDEFPAESEAPVIGFGSTTVRVGDVRRSCDEAGDVVTAARAAEPQLYYRLHNVRLHGLLQLMQEDSRLQTYTERQLLPLMRLGTAESDLLMTTLRTYLDLGRNKAATARALHLSRPTLYGRLDTVQRVLAVDIEEPQTALSLQFAIHAHDIISSAD
ncbi:PucR family transcriptional regulator [Aeromicrobium sp. CF4.19]|uniref:PucR family transcriptional regulator n=1 Tax=Aeromicrobium sp. CF4.19 TaxID=3373082 RepID=UPI003EE7C60A